MAKVDYIAIRSFLSSNVDNLLENLAIRRNAKKISADDLFGFGGDEAESLKLNTNFKPLSKIDILLSEKESLGLYVSGNPLDDYVDLWKWVRDVTLRDDLFIIIIDKVKKIFTKTGNMMFALEISIPEIEAEAIVFPKNALRISPILEEKEIFWVKGKIQNSRKPKPKTTLKTPKVTEDLDEIEEIKEVAGPIETTENEIKEFDELPKLIIDEIVKFETGVLPLFEGDDFSLALHREETMKKLDWQWLKLHPSDYKKGETVSSASITSKQTGVIFLPMSLGPELLSQIKSSLRQTAFPEAVEVKVEVETGQGVKQAKGSFWISQELYKRYKK